MQKESPAKIKIKKAALKLFNNENTLTITTNHIAKACKISPGNLYYHYKNKEEIITAIYLDMSIEFESYNSFEQILTSENPLQVLNTMYDKFGELFLKYKFLVRDIGALLPIYPSLKSEFLLRQNKRLGQIEGLLKYFIKIGIVTIEENEIQIRAKLNWFISSYWQLFTATSAETTDTSLKEVKTIVFDILIKPILTPKGQKLFKELDHTI